MSRAWSRAAKLWLGGVEIEHEKGLLGHSDADVILHAIADACLGAAALGDIGKHFPDTDPAYKGISSLKLLARVDELIEAEGWSILNVDCAVACEQPEDRAPCQGHAPAHRRSAFDHPRPRQRQGHDHRGSRLHR